MDTRMYSYTKLQNPVLFTGRNTAAIKQNRGLDDTEQVEYAGLCDMTSPLQCGIVMIL